MNNLKVSYFESVFKYTNDISIKDVFHIISNNQLKNITKQIRQETDKKKRNELKKLKLPAVTVSGTFNNSHNIKDFKNYSGLIQIDIDNIDNIQEIKQQLIKDKYTYCCFISPSGIGLKLIVKVKNDYNLHLESFNQLKQYYTDNYKIQIDEKCKDINRLMFLCSDPEIFINENANIFETKEIKPVENKTFTKPNNYQNDTVLDAEKVINQIISQRIDITENYNNWLSCGYAFADEFGDTGRNYFHKISQFYTKYDKSETDKQYDKCLKTRKNNGISPFFALARQFNIDTISVKENEPFKPQKQKIKIWGIKLVPVKL